MVIGLASALGSFASAEGGRYDRTAMGEEVKPQGVEKGGSRAKGVKGGEGREESPVPPMMAIGIGSARGELQYIF